MGKTIALVGMPQSGKTCTRLILSGNSPTSRYEQTAKLVKVPANDGSFFNLFGSTNICDLGGNESSRLNEWQNSINEADAVLFYFNGVSFIDEISHPEKGGPIGSLLRNGFCEVFKESEAIWYKKVFFVASHLDKMPNKSIDVMKQQILQALNRSENTYDPKYGGRYFFRKYMQNNLFCINALDTQSVEFMFEEIKKRI